MSVPYKAPVGGAYTINIPANAGVVIGSVGAGGGGGAGGSSGHIVVSDNSGTINYDQVIDSYSTVKTDIGSLLNRIGIEKDYGVNKCSSCGEEKATAIKYTGPGLTRHICKDCCTPIIDRFFGVNINPQTEKVLYGKK